MMAIGGWGLRWALGMVSKGREYEFDVWARLKILRQLLHRFSFNFSPTFQNILPVYACFIAYNDVLSQIRNLINFLVKPNNF